MNQLILEEEEFTPEYCEICGCTVIEPCESIPADICTKAAEVFYAQ